MSNARLMIQVQEDAAGRLRSGASFEDVRVLSYREADIESEVEKAMGVLNREGGKVGACAIVMMPSVVAPAYGPVPNAPGPLCDLLLAVDCFECVEINQGADGTGLTAEELAWSALRLLHRFYPLGYTQQWYADSQRISPVLNLEDGFRGYRVHVRVPVGVDGLVKLAAPEVSAVDAGSGNYTVTATHSDGGAVLWYSTDESLPRAGALGSAKYTGALTLQAPFTFRCVAVRAEYEDSNPAFVEVA